MSAELDRQCAAALGKPWCRPTHGTCCTCQNCGWDYGNCQCGYSDPDYPEKTKLLEDEIDQRGSIVWMRYTESLIRMVEETNPTYPIHWALIRATAEQRAGAFLEVIK